MKPTMKYTRTLITAMAAVPVALLLSLLGPGTASAADVDADASISILNNPAFLDVGAKL
ncbi:hypothetical protein [Amycolatopsis regifaucium]|uniref:hypothetical protein n=1 Tax=Amycolatopsis regifaucium TaxID=546365 RepID=UPI0008F62E3A|nr:hypothetical protein [Amycolatopsis regifaucium]SFI63426.1 hypothetical protein SAMN04489731_11214 [Amycolatopsis regifaucium]